MTNAQYSPWFTSLSAFGIQLALIFSTFTKEEKKTMEATKVVPPLSVLQNTQNRSGGLQLWNEKLAFTLKLAMKLY